MKRKEFLTNYINGCMSEATITKIITGCNDCSFCIWGGSNGYCAIKENNSAYPIKVHRNDFENIITPDWCPLKANSIIVAYE